MNRNRKWINIFLTNQRKWRHIDALFDLHQSKFPAFLMIMTVTTITLAKERQLIGMEYLLFISVLLGGANIQREPSSLSTHNH